MMNIIDLLRSSEIFSKKISRGNLFFFLALGPILLITALSISLSRFSGEKPIFPLIVLLSLLLCTKWRVKGFALSLVFQLGYFFTMMTRESLWWQILFTTALLCAFLIIALLGEEIQSFVFSQWQAKDEGAMALSFQAEKMTVMQKEYEEKQQMASASISQLQFSVAESKDHASSLKRLIEISQSEGNSLREENQTLLENLQLCHEKTQNVLQEKLEKGTNDSKDPLLLDELNKFRVENYQLRILLESCEEELDKYKKIDAEKNQLLFEKMDPSRRQSQQLDFLQKDQEETQKIPSLDHDKAELKKEFQKLLIEYDLLSQRYEETVFETKLGSHELYDRALVELEEKGDILSQTRSELFKLEGELLVAEKEKCERDLEASPTEKSLHSYLSFTDQECLRLEEENRELREIITSLTPPPDPRPIAPDTSI